MKHLSNGIDKYFQTESINFYNIILKQCHTFAIGTSNFLRSIECLRIQYETKRNGKIIKEERGGERQSNLLKSTFNIEIVFTLSIGSNTKRIIQRTLFSSHSKYTHLPECVRNSNMIYTDVIHFHRILNMVMC